jgi:NAD(P)H-nitrite reductase large subunit
MDRSKLRQREPGEYIPREDDHILLCRCEEISKGDIRRALHTGLRTFNELRRETRMGMGLCQGQTCTRIIRSFISRELGCSPDEVGMPTPRTPARPVPMAVIARDGIREVRL